MSSIRIEQNRTKQTEAQVHSVQAVSGRFPQLVAHGHEVVLHEKHLTTNKKFSNLHFLRASTGPVR